MLVYFVLVVHSLFILLIATAVVIINFSYSHRVYFSCDLPRFCHVKVKYNSGLEFEQASNTYGDLFGWIWICFPICLGLVYMAFRLMSQQEKETLHLNRESKSWQVRMCLKFANYNLYCMYYQMRRANLRPDCFRLPV